MLTFTDIKGGEVVPRGERSGCYLQIMRAHHLAAHLQVGPETGMETGLIQIKGLRKKLVRICST
jgi:hypothetical protein